MLFDKRELVVEEIDRRAHQICARLQLLSACQPARPKAQRLMLYSSQHGPEIGSAEGKRDGDQDWSRRARLRVQYLKDPPLSKEK